MKIIGTTVSGYLLEANKNEVANLIGYYNEYDQREKGKSLHIEDEIKIDAMYKQLYNLRTNQPELKKIVGTLRNLANLLEPVCPVIESAIKNSIKDNGETHE